MIRCLCIDDDGRPAEIPADKWPKVDNEYHITFVAFCHPQMVQGCNLNEIFLDENNAPYEYYKLTRFAIHMEDWEAFVQLCKDCTDLDDVVIENLIESLHMETI